MNIGTAAEATELPAKTIRYYEEIGLVRPARAANGYRDYSERDIHRLRFVQRARSLGFSIEECRLLLSLYEDEARASADVKALALDKIGEIEAKIANLQSLRAANAQLRESNAALRAAHAAGVSDPEAINASLQAELDALRAARDADRDEVAAVLAEIDSAVAGAAPGAADETEDA